MNSGFKMYHVPYTQHCRNIIGGNKQTGTFTDGLMAKTPTGKLFIHMSICLCKSRESQVTDPKVWL